MASTTIEYCMMYTTVPNEAEAKKLAKKLVDERLANFVNVMPAMQTVYRETNGESVETDTEILVMAKIRTKQTAVVFDQVSKQHPYDVAEIFTVPLTHLCEPMKENLKVNLKVVS